MKTCIIVTGMHRSGTSMMAGILHHCGIYTGPCIQPDQYNEKGYFEDKAVLEINKKLIGDWKNPEFGGEFHGYDFSNYPDIFFLKDPRFMLTLADWIICNSKIEFKVIFMNRPGSEIIESLNKRNGKYNWKETIYTYFSGERHLKNYILDVDDYVEFRYIDVLNDPIHHLHKICGKFDIKLDVNLHVNKILKFVDRRLKHN